MKYLGAATKCATHEESYMNSRYNTSMENLSFQWQNKIHYALCFMADRTTTIQKYIE